VAADYHGAMSKVEGVDDDYPVVDDRMTDIGSFIFPPSQRAIDR